MSNQVSQVIKARESLYRIGDVVTIRYRDHLHNEYMGIFTDSMTKFSGQKATILQVQQYVGMRLLSVESYTYLVDIDNKIYVWSAEMFQETPQFSDRAYWDNVNLRIFTPNMIKIIQRYVKIDNLFTNISYGELDSLIPDNVDWKEEFCDVFMGKTLRTSLRKLYEKICGTNDIYMNDTLYDCTNKNSENESVLVDVCQLRKLRDDLQKSLDIINNLINLQH